GLSVQVIYVADVTVLAEYYVICTGRSSTHVRALANHLEEQASKQGITALHAEGKDNAEWVLLDFGDVIVHIFSREAREFYRLEKLFKPEAFLPIPEVPSEENQSTPDFIQGNERKD
ncbi:MAG: ribosome silencing factor, partial [Clostridia bacterium]|nr:ribosome silencing factor [Clostridia bacterium]